MPQKRCCFIDDAADDEDGGASDEDEDEEEEDDLGGFIVADGAPETDEEEVEGAQERTRRERKPHRDLSEDDLDLILENAGMKDPYEQSKKRRREKGRRRTRKVVSSSNSEEEAFPVPVKEAPTPTHATQLKAVSVPVHGSINASVGGGAGVTQSVHFLETDSFYSNCAEEVFVVDEGENDSQQGSWSQRERLKPLPKPALASVFNRGRGVKVKAEYSSTQMHRRQDGSLYYKDANGHIEERGRDGFT